MKKKRLTPWWRNPPGPPPAGCPADALWLSPSEEAILYACSDEHFRSARDISKDADVPSNRRRNVPYLLKNLVNRRILESHPDKGFRIRTTKRTKPRKSA